MQRHAEGAPISVRWVLAQWSVYATLHSTFTVITCSYHGPQ